MRNSSFSTYLLLALGLTCALLHSAFAIEDSGTLEKVARASEDSEDGAIVNFHTLGEINGHAPIYRSANPVGVIVQRMHNNAPTDSDRQQAREQMQRLVDRGVRTIVSLQRQQPPTEKVKNPEFRAVELEKAAAEAVGLTYIAYPMGNSGKNSLQDMSPDAVFQLVESVSSEIVNRSEKGGVLFHCQSGKDRTGLVAGYIRIKYQHWSLDQSLQEMRQRGHVWKKFLRPGSSYSWHEEHLQAMANRSPAPR